MIRKNIYSIITLLSIVFTCINYSQSTQSQNIQHVKVQEFISKIQDSTVVVVDVRSAKEHAAGFIPRTNLNIDVMGSDFEEQVSTQIPNSSVVAIYCRSGNRSKRAAEILDRMGYEVIELDHGYKAWLEYNKQ